MDAHCKVLSRGLSASLEANECQGSRSLGKIVEKEVLASYRVADAGWSGVVNVGSK